MYELEEPAMADLAAAIYAVHVAAANTSSDSNGHSPSASSTSTSADATPNVRKPDTSTANLALFSLELFEYIAEQVDERDLDNLRRTSVQCTQKVRSLWLKVHFSDVVIILTSNQSIEDALALATHSVAGPFVRTVLVHTADAGDQPDQDLLMTFFTHLGRLGSCYTVNMNQNYPDKRICRLVQFMHKESTCLVSAAETT